MHGCVLRNLRFGFNSIGEPVMARVEGGKAPGDRGSCMEKRERDSYV